MGRKLTASAKVRLQPVRLPLAGMHHHQESDRQYIGSLLKGLSILDAYSGERLVLSIGDLAKQLTISKSSVSRLAATLESAGFLQRAGERGRYRLGPKLAHLGELSRTEQDLRGLVRPVMMDLVDACGETTHLGVREGTECMTIDFIEGTHTVRMTTSVGKRGKLFATSIGKCLLAWLSPEERDAIIAGFSFERWTPKTIKSASALRQELNAVRKSGFAVDMEELEVGLACIGAPIMDATNKVIAAISISGPSSRINRGTLPRLARLVRSAAADASARLGAPKNGAAGPVVSIVSPSRWRRRH